MTGGNTLWYLSRATGLVSLVLLTLTVLGGILVRRGVTPNRLPRFVMWGLHRNVALLSVAFLGLHIATVVLDSYVPINLLDAVVPFTSAYRPIWLGLGAVAFDLLLAVIVTSLLRARIGHRTWRAVHWLGYALWPTAVVHGLGTGSDVGNLWFLTVTAGCILAVGAAVTWRLSATFQRSNAVRSSASGHAVARPLATTSAGAR
ncbi:MAG: ferric reductase-like transmembrane domain-containing protein [Actinomycetes bacterium]